MSYADAFIIGASRLSDEQIRRICESVPVFIRPFLTHSEIYVRGNTAGVFANENAARVLCRDDVFEAIKNETKVGRVDIVINRDCESIGKVRTDKPWPLSPAQRSRLENGLTAIANNGVLGALRQAIENECEATTEQVVEKVGDIVDAYYYVTGE